MGLELLAEAGNFAAVQRMLQNHPYFGAYGPPPVSAAAAGAPPVPLGLTAAFDSAFLRQGLAAAMQAQAAVSQHPLLAPPPRVLVPPTSVAHFSSS